MVPRDGVACASAFNWCSFILMLFATISAYWTWGYSYLPPNSGISGTATVSLGPWVAAQAWSNVAVPCNCVNGVCTRWCVFGTIPVRWDDIPVENACGPNSTVFRTWSGPLGYCQFPEGSNIVLPPFDQDFGAGVTGIDLPGNVPAGTTFNGPSQIPAIQALTIISTITVFFAAFAGCADAGADSGSKGLGVAAAACSLISWVFCLAAYCTWAGMSYVQKITAFPPQVYLPVWVNSTYMSAIEVNDTWLGPGWATALTASILTFLANLIHCASLKTDPDKFESRYNAEPVPTAAQPVPVAAQPVPVAAQPVPVATQPVPAAAQPIPPAVQPSNVAVV